MTDTSDRPLVSIGMPVYNGEAYLEAALKSLQSQDYPAIEIIISDNASTDRSEEICRRIAAQDPRVRYLRSAENVGAVANFVRVLENSTGSYFMWAAHDDRWNPGFVSALVDALQSRPDAVLATPNTVRVQPDGSPSSHDDDRHAPGRSRLGNLRVFYADLASCWIYGLYRTRWIQAHVHELSTEGYPIWGGDVMWMASVLVRYAVVGSSEAVIHKRLTPDSYDHYAPKTEEDKVRYALEMLRQLTSICRRHCGQRLMRMVAVALSWHFAYHRYVRRGNPLKTLRRLMRLPGIVLQARADRCRKRGAQPGYSEMREAVGVELSQDRQRTQADAA